MRGTLILSPLMLAAVTVAASGTASARQDAGSAGKPFLLFFDWGEREVRRDDRSVLDKAAEASRTGAGQHLTIVGHTDRSGSAATNKRSGLRRAQAVADALAERGVPRANMTLTSRGEEQPLIPTEDGVREVQNRRVEIFLGDAAGVR